jgi:hypothetical protein
VSVTTTSGCSWSAVSNVPWITIGAGGSGTGSGTVTYNVAVNMTTSARTGTLSVGAQILTVVEAASSGAPIAPTNFRIYP